MGKGDPSEPSNAAYARPVVMPTIDHDDYAVVVKVKEGSAKPWTWAISRAGRRSPVKTSMKVSYATRVEAQREGKQALDQLLMPRKPLRAVNS